MVRRMRLISLCLATLMAGSALAIKPGLTDEKLSFGGAERSYLLQVPPQYDGKRRLPLVMLVHGYTGNPNAILGYSGMGPIAEKEGFILVVPRAVGQPTGWNCDFLNLGKAGVDDIGFLTKVLDEVEGSLMVDRSRVFVAGHSNGAMMANCLGSKLSNRLAGIACVAGVIGVGVEGKEKTISKPSSPLSVLHIHGRADNVVAFDRTAKALLKGVTAPQAVTWWADAVGIKSSPKVSKTGTVERTVFSGGGQTVELIAIDGWTHDWPTSGSAHLDAGREIWDFFKSLRPKIR